MHQPPSSIRLCVLASGSAGNCAYLETPRMRVLIDAGLSGRQIAQRLASIGRRLEDVQAILITHEHSDHVTGLPALLKGRDIPVYANRPTADWLQRQRLPQFSNWKLFKTGGDFGVGDIHVQSFPLPHDACEPSGFTLSYEHETVGFVTDLGYATERVIYEAAKCSVLLLETNHDLELLRTDTKRPWAVKQRILARHGHLSNEEGAAVVEKILSDRLRHLFLCHLSRDCNRPELAQTAVSSKLNRLGASHVRLHQTHQQIPCPLLEL